MKNRAKYNEKRTDILLRHIPEELINIKFICSKCNFQHMPNLLEPLKDPFIPVKPIYYNKQPYDGPMRWIPQEIIIKCPNCDGDIHIKTPVIKIRAKVMFYGDEAYRTYQNKFVCTYSLIGADHTLIPDINRSIFDIKSKLCPSRPPESWGLHMKDLYSGNNRKRHDLFHSLDINKIQFAIDSLFQIIHDNIKKLFVYNVALTAPNDGLTNRVKTYSYILLIMNVIDELTDMGAQPHLFFDAEKPTQSDRAIQAWARDSFFGSQHCLLYSFLAKGIEIPEPQFVSPASQPCLELADFVSYVIARYHFLKWQGKDIHMDPLNFGLVTYIGFDKKGDMLWARQVGYPWEKFYK